MAKYTVHLYPVIRVTLDGIEALTKQEAIEKAVDEIDTACFENLGCNISFAKEYHDPCLVDVEGDGLMVKLQLTPTNWDGSFFLVPPKEE